MNDLNETDISGQLDSGPTSRPDLLYPYRRVTPKGCSRDFAEMIEVAHGNLPSQRTREGVAATCRCPHGVRLFSTFGFIALSARDHSPHLRQLISPAPPLLNSSVIILGPRSNRRSRAAPSVRYGGRFLRNMGPRCPRDPSGTRHRHVESGPLATLSL